MNTERDEREQLAVILELEQEHGNWASTPEADLYGCMADVILAAGYRKAERVTEYGTIFNKAAVFLNPPAEGVDVFKERFEQELGWILTERDPIIARTFLRCDPEPSEPTQVGGAECRYDTEKIGEQG